MKYSEAIDDTGQASRLIREAGEEFGNSSEVMKHAS